MPIKKTNILETQNKRSLIKNMASHKIVRGKWWRPEWSIRVLSSTRKLDGQKNISTRKRRNGATIKWIQRRHLLARQCLHGFLSILVSMKNCSIMEL
jgi:hypothetical protein